MRVVGSRPVGAVPGFLCGLLAGTFVSAAWINDRLLGFAVAGIAAGLVACVVWAAPGWQRFGAGLLAGTVLAVVLWFAVPHAVTSLRL